MFFFCGVLVFNLIHIVLRKIIIIHLLLLLYKIVAIAKPALIGAFQTIYEACTKGKTQEELQVLVPHSSIKWIVR